MPKLKVGTTFSGIGTVEASIMASPALYDQMESAFYAELLGDPSEKGPDARNSRCACAVMQHHFRHIPNVGDVKVARVPLVDILVGGGMCTCFSGSNRHHPGRLDPVSLLLLHNLELGRRAGARYIIWENTDALMAGDHRPYLDELVRIARDGYGYCMTFGTIDTQMFGDCPVSRRRMWAIGALGRPDIARAIAEMWPKETRQADPSRIEWSNYLGLNVSKRLLLSQDVAKSIISAHGDGSFEDLPGVVRVAFTNAATIPPDEIPDAPGAVMPIFWQRRPQGLRWSSLCPTLQKGGWHDLGTLQNFGEILLPRRLSGHEMQRMMGLPDGWLDVPDPDAPDRMLDDQAMAKLLGNAMHISQPRWALETLLKAIDSCPLWPSTSKPL